jgi:hypothetical protein
MKSVLLGFAAAAALATTASATTAVFDFQTPGPNASAGTSQAYTNNGLTITASGFASNGGAATTLFDKSNGGDENGLGLTDDPSGDNEITGTNFVQIDVTAIPGFLTDAFSFQMGSSTGGEEWKVFGSNTAGSFSGSALVTGTDELAHGLTSGFKYYDFETPGTLCPGSVDFCGSGNTLIHTFTAVTAVPEPATWAMMLLGIGGLGATLRMSRKSAGAAALA